MRSHLENLGNDGLSRPFNTEYVCELLRMTVAASRMLKTVSPSHDMHKFAKLLVEERNTELVGKQWDVLDDSLTDTPLLVLGEFNDRWQQ